MRRALLAATIALAVAGCGDGDAGPETLTQTGVSPPPPPPPPATTVVAPPPRRTAARVAGTTLLQFVRAAATQDSERMWELLSTNARTELGPTAERFGAGAAVQLQEGLGSLTGIELILSERVGPSLSVAAVGGERVTAAGGEYYVYAVAMRFERGGWKAELAAPVRFGSFTPEPLAVTGGRPLIGAGIEAIDPLRDARLWLDGKRFTNVAARAGTRAGISERPAQPLARGVHTVVVFARTATAASAAGWSFTVRR